MSKALQYLITGIGIISTAIVGIYAINALTAMLVWVVMFGGIALVAWALLGRLWDALRHGKPMLRGGFFTRPGGSSRSSDTTEIRDRGVIDESFIGTDSNDKAMREALSDRPSNVESPHRLLDEHEK